MKDLIHKMHFAYRRKGWFRKRGTLSLFEPKTREDMNEEARVLEDMYDLSHYRGISSENDYYVSLHYLSILKSFISQPNRTHVIDVGSKTFFYAEPMYQYFKQKNQSFALTGIEIDGYRRYENGHTRCDYADYYTKHLTNCRYVIDDFLNLQRKADVITFFLPFVTIDPLVNWGLPKQNFTPQKLLSHAHACLNNEGIMLIVNQDEEEQRALFGYLDQLNLPYQNKGSYFSPFYHRHTHYVTIVHKYGKIVEKE